MQKDPYIIVKSVKKDFPNKIKVEIEERQEIFIIVSDLKRYYLDKNFYVLKVEDKQSTLLNNQLILLNVSNYKNFDYATLNTHSVVTQIDGWIKNSITEMINIFTDWKNILGGIEVTGTNDILGYNIYFETRQGLVIEVKDPNIGYNENNEPIYKEPSDTEGIDIIRKVYEKYSTISDDEKTKGKLLVTKQQDGTITVVHSTRG